MTVKTLSEVSHHPLADLVGQIGMPDSQQTTQHSDPRHYSSQDPQQVQVWTATSGEEGRVEHPPG